MKVVSEGEKEEDIPGLRDCIVAGLGRALNGEVNVGREEDLVSPPLALASPQPPQFLSPPSSPHQTPHHPVAQVLCMQPLLLCSPSPGGAKFY